MLLAAVALGALAHSKVEAALARPWVFPIVLGGLAVLAVLLRLPTAGAIDSIFGGDAFNYVMKSRALIEGSDPFAIDPRKAPFLSLLLLPGLALVDPLVMGRAIGIVSAAIGVILIALIARRLQFPRVLALVAAALLMVNRLWWWESVHGLANIPYAVLLLGAVLAFLTAKHYLLSVLVGLATLTRYEGALAAATLVPSTWVLQPKWRTIWRSVLPVVILIAIPLVLWPFTGNSGVRTSEDILADPGLYIAWDWHDYISNLHRFRHFVGQLWYLQPLVGNQLTAFVGGLIAGLIISTRARWSKIPRTVLAVAPLAAAGVLIGYIAYGNEGAIKLALLGLTVITGMGLGILNVQQPKRVIPLALMLCAQVLFVTAILPKHRYYLIVIPFAALFLVAGTVSLLDWKRTWHRASGLLALGALLGLAYANTTASLPGQISEYNDVSGPATELAMVGKYLRQHPGTVGAPRYADLFMRVYQSPKTVTLLSTENPLAPEAELQLLRDKKIDYVFSVQSGKNLISLETFPEAFTLEAEVPGGKIYRVLP